MEGIGGASEIVADSWGSPQQRDVCEERITPEIFGRSQATKQFDTEEPDVRRREQAARADLIECVRR